MDRERERERYIEREREREGERYRERERERALAVTDKIHAPLPHRHIGPTIIKSGGHRSNCARIWSMHPWPSSTKRRVPVLKMLVSYR